MGLGVSIWIGEDIMEDMRSNPSSRKGVGIEVPHKEGIALGGMWEHAWLRRAKGSVRVDLR